MLIELVGPLIVQVDGLVEVLAHTTSSLSGGVVGSKLLLLTQHGGPLVGLQGGTGCVLARLVLDRHVLLLGVVLLVQVSLHLLLIEVRVSHVAAKVYHIKEEKLC